MLVSIVAPVYNEEKNIQKLYDEIKGKVKNDFELILVNDGSKDNSFQEILKISSDRRVKYINFARNFGKESAMFAGLKASIGDCVVIMDSDLQHPPEYIDVMVDEHLNGYDQVVMKRNRDGENFLRKNLSHLFYKMVNSLVDTKLSDGEGDFRLISRRVANAILSLDEYNRFSKGIFEWVGFKKKVIDFKNVERFEGESSFNFKSLFNYAVDGVLSYNDKPLRTCLHLGLLIAFVSLLYIIFTLVSICFNGIKEPGYFTIISSILLLGGVQLISLGIIGEYVGRIYYEVKKRPHFIVGETNVKDFH